MNHLRCYAFCFGVLLIPTLCRASRAGGSDGQEQFRTGRVYDTADDPFMVLDPAGGLRYGDPFPAYFDGVWHLYTLQSGLGAVRHLTSTDLVTWIEHEPALTGGGIATGVVVRHEGRYHMFYTTGQMGVGVVSSDTPYRFDRATKRKVAGPDPEYYPDPKVFRDVYVFYHEEEKLWWMLFEVGGARTGVVVGVYKAEHIEGPWKPHPPVYTHPRDGHRFHQFVSCPEIFRQGNVWYLTYLSNDTHYHVASAPEGPWGAPKGQYNSDFLTAGSRTVSDGRRRLNWGFFTVRPTPENQGARPRYGGPLGVGREMVFFDDHTIGVRPLPELIAAIRERASDVDVFPLMAAASGNWRFDADRKSMASLDEAGGAAAITVPGHHPDYYFEADIEFGESVTAVSVTVRTCADSHTGYRVALLPERETFEITEPAGQRRTYLSKSHPFRKVANLKVFISDGQLEAFVDGRSDLSTRVLNTSGTKLMLKAEGGKAVFRNPVLHYFKRE